MPPASICSCSTMQIPRYFLTDGHSYISLHQTKTDLEGDEDDEVGEVEREDLAAGGGSGDHLEGCLQQGGALCS